jgi:hypothetical protein
LPVLQGVPFAAGGLVHRPVAGLHDPGVVHGPLAVQTTGFEPTHAPSLQEQVWSQRFVPVQGVPFGAAGLLHCPVAGLHDPATAQTPWAWHVTGVPPQVPLLHWSFVVQALPSLQLVPLGWSGFEQVPVDGEHVPTPWHWSSAVQTTGFEPTHAPDWHV